jgi:hypothetical protein
MQRHDWVFPPFRVCCAFLVVWTFVFVLFLVSVWVSWVLQGIHCLIIALVHYPQMLYNVFISFMICHYSLPCRPSRKLTSHISALSFFLSLQSTTRIHGEVSPWQCLANFVFPVSSAMCFLTFYLNVLAHFLDIVVNIGFTYMRNLPNVIDSKVPFL